jgi:branched-chain amino acid transport system substrate-binding protein
MFVRRMSTLVCVAALLVTAGGAATKASTLSAHKGFVLRVGLIYPFTGDLSTFGPSLDKGSILGAKLLNTALKKDHINNVSFKIVGSEDDQTQAAAGVEAAKKLVNVDHAQMLIATMSSGITIAIAQSVSIPNNVLQITPTASDPAITNLSGKNGLLWRIYPSDALQGAALAAVMGKAFGKHATINVGARNDAYGTALSQVFEKAWKKGGGKVGNVVIYNPDEASFDADAQKLAAGNPAGWMIADFGPTFEKMGPALVRAGGWSPAKTFMTEAMDNNDELNKIGAPATEGLRGTAGSAPSGSLQNAFETLYKKTYPTQAFTGFEGTGFDAMVLGGLGAIAADSSNPSAIKKHLRAVSGPPGQKFTWQQLPQAIAALWAGKAIHYIGAWGDISWDSHGDPGSAIYVVWQHKGGQTSNISKINFHSK